MFQLVSCGGCDFSKEEAQKHSVEIVPFYVTLDHETHLKEGVDISKEEYFKRLKEDSKLFPKTAQPSPQDYMDVYTPYIEAGKDIISLTISSKLSGTYNSATLAANTLMDEYPDRKIVVVDSLNGSVGQGLILKELIKMRDIGFSVNKAAKIAKEVVKTTQTYFSLDNLEYLKRGGRVGPTTALVGGILGLRPVLYLANGSVEQLDSVRGKKKVIQLMEEGVSAVLRDDIDNININVGHILSGGEADYLKARLENSLGIKMLNEPAEVGVTIGTHAGPGALVVSYCKKYEAIVNNQKNFYDLAVEKIGA